MWITLCYKTYFVFFFYSRQVLNREPIFTSLYFGERSLWQRSCHVLHSIKQIHTTWYQTRTISCHDRTGIFINLISTWCYIEWSIDNILLRVSFISMTQQPLVGQPLIIESSRRHSDTLHSVGRLWTSDQPDAETSSWQYTTLTRDGHPCPLQDSNPQSQQAIGSRPKP